MIGTAHAQRAPPAVVAAAPPGYTLPGAHEIERGIVEMPPPPHIVRRVARAATTIGTAAAAFLLVNNMAALFIGAPIAIRFAAQTPDRVVSIFVVFPIPVEIFSLGGPAAAVWHVLLVAAISASFAHLALRHGRDAWAKLLRAVRGEGTPTLSEPNGFFVIARIWAASLFVVITISLVASALGSPPNIPSSLQNADAGALLVSLAHASVWEELVTRVLLLGVPLALLHLAARGKIERPASRYLFGGGFTLDAPAVFLLLFQGAVFGIAHAPGWDLWKVPSAAFFGIALGFLFLRYGLAACILLHFLNDYLFASTALTQSASYSFLVGFIVPLLLLIVGVVCAIRYVFVLWEIIMLRRIPEYLGGPSPAAPVPSPGLPPALRVDDPVYPPGGRG